MFNEKEEEQILAHGLDLKTVQNQIELFKSGMLPLKLALAATNDHGILQISDEDQERFIGFYEKSLRSGLRALKFVPASGAASRMFSHLFAFANGTINEDDENIQLFFSQIEKFAFYDDLMSLIPEEDRSDRKFVVKALLSEEGLNYGSLPKGLLKFHKYAKGNRTPFEEHLVEAASYCLSATGKAFLHFTVSPEFMEEFESTLQDARQRLEKRFGISFDVSFSVQKKSTDTIAVTPNNELFKDNEKLLFRPGGHGALIENLNELEADIVFVKNIDNVVPDKFKNTTLKYKKALAGILLDYRTRIFNYLEKLDKKSNQTDEYFLDAVESFIRKDLNYRFKTYFSSKAEKINFLKEKLNRPLRVCGMVKNEGEPGGGPFWVVNKDATVSLQIVESVQINQRDPFQKELFEQATHFNPVDLVCSTKNYKGEKFDLLKYVDSKAGFISHKSKGGKDLKAMELPGLWNGAMADWITIFVEVPSSTFSPVKTINDLLRESHQ